MHFKLALCAVTFGLTITAAQTARAGGTTCEGWDTTANWGSAGYAVGNVALRYHATQTSVPVIIEVSTDDDVLTAAGTFSLGADWDTENLDGTYSAQWTITVYSGLDHVGTPAELAAWPASRIFRLNTNSGIFKCEAPPEPICGNGFVEADEDCDDGNDTSGDGCSVDCYLEICGNGTVDAQEQCDDGNTASADGCSATCTAEICGNGVLDANEACDDGNTTNNDGCSSSCTNEFCGDGVVQGTEGCDDGNTAGGDGCSATCGLEECGNLLLEGSEECDDGNIIGGDGCSGTCTAEYCGNGVTEGSEQCDDGNAANGDGCSGNCTTEVCGNGITDSGEGCDDGNTEGGDGCSANCHVEVCGNGVIEGSEQCDDGNLTNSDGCSAACVIEPPPPPPTAGCTKTQGYWKTHNATERNPRRIPWPISENTQLCGKSWLTILETSPRGNAWYILAHQYIAARLNLASGASSTPDVTLAMSRSTTLLAGCSVSTANRALATDLSSLLDDYNNGQTGPGHCDGDIGGVCNDHTGHRHHRSGHHSTHRHGHRSGHSHRHHHGCGHSGH